VNYYDHHIRDYDAATAHLTWDEDMAYTRLIRWYYRKEMPVPADLKEACRQVRASTKTQRDAVAAVLKEFFVLREDGWHQETCDDAIAAFQAGEPEREVKKANEDNRLRRHRDERARLFKIITDAGQHASWNIKMDDLRAMASRVTGNGAVTSPATEKSDAETPPATPPATAPATPATATQYPFPNTQTPVLKEEMDSAGVRAGDGDDYLPSATAAGALAKLLRAHGVQDASPGNPTLRAWAEAGLTEDEALAGLETARSARAAPNPMTWPYLARVLETQRQKAAAGVPDKPVHATAPGKRAPSAAQQRADWLAELDDELRGNPREIDMGVIDATGQR